jgi:hypothetical protein
MSSLLDRKNGRSDSPCDRFQEWLEESRSPEAAPETLDHLLSTAPAAEHAHALACSDCRDAAADLVDLRNLLRELGPAPVAGPWFASRVMADIASREVEISRVTAFWLAIPRFASRLSWIAAAALVFTATWLHERPIARQPQTASAYASDHLFDPPVAAPGNDDLLLSMTGNSR